MLRLLLISALLSALSFSAAAHDEVTPKPKLLQNGVPVTQLSGHPGDSVVYKIDVPPDVEKLTVRSKGGKGDVDLYVRRNVHPTPELSDGSSRGAGNDERVVIRTPGAGPWYVLVDPFSEFRGVQLTAEYQLERGAVAIPKLLPAPGVFGGAAAVQIKCPTKGAVIRYTTDGTEPSADSARYLRVLKLTSDTRLRARAFGRNGRVSPEVEGTYFIQAPGEITTLTNGQPLHHRAGQAGSEQIFKITIPAGQKFLRIFSEGGPGDTELLVSKGAPPTKRGAEFKADGRGNSAFLEIADPAAGDWFVVLRGRRNYSGVSITAVARLNLPDLIVWRPAITPHLSVETFSAEDCEVQEGMIEPGTHTLLRFNTETRNIGGADLVLPDPEGNPNFEFQECHGHYHFKGFAAYRLLDANGLPVALGRKVSFCLLDIERWDSHAAPHRRYHCSHQGIQAGWADIYDAGLPGQWIDVTDVPDGRYTLEITMNPEAIIEEADHANNVETLEVVIDTSALAVSTP